MRYTMLYLLIVIVIASVTIMSVYTSSAEPITLIKPVIEYKYVEVGVDRPVYIEVEKPSEPSIVDAKSLGEFTVTYYTANAESTGKSKGHPEYGITKSGARVEAGVTVAVDPKVIPLGTYLYIEGVGFRVAQDVGGAIKGNRIDVYVTEVVEALELGKHEAKVYTIGGN